MTDCIFCKIIDGSIPSAKVYEDEKIVAFLDLTQTTKGHTLVVPKQHVANIFEYDADIASDVAQRLPIVAKALQLALPDMQGLNILNNNGSVAYQTVFHSHWHLIPRYHVEDGLTVQFTDHSKEYSQESFQELGRTIANKVEEAKR